MSGNSDPEYRLGFRTIELPADGRVPATGIPALSISDLDRWLGLIGETWTRVQALRSRKRLVVEGSIRADEPSRAWRVWMVSHHAFFPVYALLAKTYDEMADAKITEGSSEVLRLARRSANLNLAAGSLLAFGVNFEPVVELYARLRSEMPPAFSGFWLREAEILTECRSRWIAVEPAYGTPVAEATAIERQGRNGYHAYHVEVMRRTVPDGQSLRKTYAKESGCPHAITAKEFLEYDKWFRITRRVMTRLEFVESTCTALTAAADDILSGSRLDDKAVADLVVGLEAVLCMMASWFGPIPEASIHSRRELRGE